jgi:hypothetical protein
MTRNDRAALKLALEMCRAESPGRARQIDAKLEDESCPFGFFKGSSALSKDPEPA